MPRHFYVTHTDHSTEAADIYLVRSGQAEDLEALTLDATRISKTEALYLIEEGEALLYLDGEAGHPRTVAKRLEACAASTDRFLET